MEEPGSKCLSPPGKRIFLSSCVPQGRRGDTLYQEEGNGMQKVMKRDETLLPVTWGSKRERRKESMPAHRPSLIIIIIVMANSLSSLHEGK